MSLPRDVARVRRDQAARARRSPRAGVTLPVRVGTDVFSDVTGVDGIATIEVTAPRGRVAVLKGRAPTHTGGFMVIGGATAPGVPSYGAGIDVPLPRGQSVSIDVLLLNSGGSPVSGRTVSASVFAF